MIINVSGFGYSGSGAVIDYLKEFEETQVLNFEFNILYVPDGIRDLEHHLCEEPYTFMSSDMAINRFLKRMDAISELIEKKRRPRFMMLANDYIHSLTQVEWTGYSMIHRAEYSHFKRKIRLKLPDLLAGILRKIGIKITVKDPLRHMYLSVNPSDFAQRTQDFLSQLWDFFELDIHKNIVCDQMLTPSNNFLCMKYFDEVKNINVIRDPRDVYVLIKAELPRKGKPIPGFIPTDTVEKFIEFYKLLVKPDERTKHKSCIIRFEDLIYQYEPTCKTISDYLNIRNHTRKKEFFNPDVSVNNTQLFKKHSEYEKDIKRIEEMLPEYLYDFEKYSMPSFSMEAF